jgi:hypothetical protein
MPIRLTLALPALTLAACSTQGSVGVPDVVTYQCAEGRSFMVERTAEAATVLYSEESYRLTRRPSSIGVRYASREATLLLDDDFAAFATEMVIDLQDCRRRTEETA